MRHDTIIAAAALLCATAVGRAAGAQESSIEGHANYARTTQTHLDSWGAGAQYGLTFGSKHKPQLATSLGVDYTKQEKSGPQQINGSLDASVQVPVSPMFAPYVGGSVGVNRTTGGGQPASTEPGFQYIVGAQLEPDPQSPIALHAEVRPGYVRGQEHAVTYRFGIAFSL
ncbi:MAG TPA: outer membrane beta-barrel protein [Gemmatimonadaceae bacterium]|nr:outer membrane beta-barrel protein [Gemmatimonadaceae bacterium]